MQTHSIQFLDSTPIDIDAMLDAEDERKRSDDESTEPPEGYNEKMRDEAFLAACEAFSPRIVPGFDIMMIDEAHVDAFRALPDPKTFVNLHPFPMFDSVIFVEHDHHYEVFNEAMNAYERCRGSVTGAIHVPFKHFDPKFHAKRIADSNRRYGEYANMTAEEIEHLWVFGANCGSAFHKSAELFLNDPFFSDIPEEFTTSPVLQSVEFGYFLRFVRDHIVGQVDIIRTELRLTDWRLNRDNTYVAQQLRAGKYYPHDPVMQKMLPMVKLAGSADLICHRRSDKDPNSVEIWDWKRSKKIRDTAFDKTFGKWPCDMQPDANLYHYQLQLNLYQWMLENNTEMRVTARKVIVFHPSNDSYLIFEIPNLQTIVQRLMIQRLQENRSLPPLDTPADIAEHVRYSAEIDQYFATAPKDPTKMWG